MKIYLLLITLFFNCSIVFSQNTNERAKELLIGRVYQNSINKAEGHAFWNNDEFFECKLSYKDMEFDNLLVKYDLLNQQIILYQSIDSFIPRYIILNDKLINDFEVIVNDNKCLFSARYSQIPGIKDEIKFYQVIFDSKVKYVVGYNKIIKELAIDGQIDLFILDKFYYLIINKKASLIKKRKDIFLVFPEHKKELKAFIRKNKLRIRPENFNDIKVLLSYYETIF